MLELALKQNMTLRKLELRGNRFGPDDVKALFVSTHGNGDFNSAYDSNHICQIDAFQSNELDDPRDNWIQRCLLVQCLALKTWVICQLSLC